MKQESNDVKALAAQITSFLARSQSTVLDSAVLQAFIPVLVNGSKEKNTLVRSNSEFGLIALLKLRDGDKTYKVRKGNANSSCFIAALVGQTISEIGEIG